MLLCDKHDLINKAVGLDVKRGRQTQSTHTYSILLDKNAPDMSRTMLRYAIEKLTPTTRQAYLSVKSEVSLMHSCPCGLNVDYGSCCGLYHSNKAIAKTPEALMQSRYMAYTLATYEGNIKRTMQARNPW